MPKLNKLTPHYCKTFPDTLEEGILYISHDYNTTNHLCPCGCKEEIIVPFHNGLSPKMWWDLSERDGKVTLHPSILSRALPCQSHYFIVDNEVRWC